MGFADTLIKNKKKYEENYEQYQGNNFADTLINEKKTMNQNISNTINVFNSVEPTIKNVESTIDTTQSTVEQPKEEKKGFSFSIDDKKKTEKDYKKERDASYDKLIEYKKEKGINLFNESKFKKDKTYQKLLKDTQEKQQLYDDSKVEKNTKKLEKDLENTNPVIASIARTGIALGSGATRGFEGIESTVRKITNQEQENQKYNYNEPMLNAAQKGANKGEQIAMNISQSIGQMVPQMMAPGTKTATALGFANYGGSAYNDAKKEGATEEQATAYGIASGSLEMLMEKVLGGFENIYGKKLGKDFTGNVMNKLIKNKAVRDTLSGMKGEFTEEYLQEFLEPILKNIILKEDNGADFWNTMKYDLGAGLKQLGSQFFNKQNAIAGLYGAATSGALEGPVNFANQNVINQQQNVPQMIEQPQIPTQTLLNEINQEVLQQNIQTPMQQQTPQITPLNQVNQELQETRQNDIANQVQVMNLEQTQNANQVAKEIDNKNRERFKNDKDISYNSVDELLKLDRTKGGRTQEYENSMKEKIKQKGIEEPIEIAQKENGEYYIQDGNHRLEIAKELGLKEIPVKYVESYEEFMNNLENEDKNDYNEYIKGENNNENTNIYSGISQNNEASGNINKNTNENSKSLNRVYSERTDTISNQEQGYNNRPSSNAKDGKIDARGIKNEELDNSSFSNKNQLTKQEQNELDGLKAVENSGFAELTKEEQTRMEELEKKSQGITKKFPELNKTVTQEDIKPLYFKYKNNEISRANNKILNEAKNMVEANNQGRRTKEQWLQIAEYIGSNADIKNSTDLQKLAMETWLASRPNTKDNLNRQGKKYVDFKTNEWFNAMYKGAGVGTDIKLSKDEVQPKERNTINESTKDDVVKMSAKDITNTLNDTKKGIVPDGKKMRRWVDTSNTATGMEDSINKADIDKITYEVQSNKKTYEQAVANTKNMSYEQKVFNAQNKLNSNKKTTLTDLAEAQLALREAATKGDTKTYLNLQQDIAIMGTELGQMVQSLSMIQRLSPDGQLMMLQKIVNRQQKLGNKNWDGVEFKEELVQKVLDSYDDASHTTFNKEKMDQAVYDLKQDLADQMKVGISDKINEWRYLSMLGNPKTHIRNIVANVAMTTTKRIKDTLNAGMQDLLIRDSNKKTATLKPASKEVKELSKQAYKETFEINQGNKYNEKNEIENKRQIFKTKPIEAVRKANAKALDIEDQVFKKLEFQRAFSNYLTAQNIKTTQDIETHPEIIQQAKAFALEESKIATFQQDNEFANWINKLDKKGPIAKVVRGAVIPFTRTPLNIAKTGLEYAPGTGLLTTIADVKKAPENMKGNVAINGLSKQITGTSLALVGYALAKSGLLQSGEDDDKEGKFKKDQGLSMGFSIKLGDKFYDLSWLSPSSMPLFVGASMFEQLEKTDGINGNVIMEGIANTLDPLSEMSCISSFTDVLQSFQQGSSKMISQMGQKTAQNYISQFVPTVSSQFARLFDTKKRVTNADRTSGFKFGEETKNQLMYKIPGLRNLLPEQTDYFGETKEEEQNVLVRGLEAFLSPANSKKDISTPEAQELLDIYNSTGDTDVLPSSLSKYLKYDGENIDMSNKEWNEYKYNFGTTLKENLNELKNNYEYNLATDEEKAEMISGLMKYSKDKAKDIFLESQGKEWEYTSDKVDAKRDGNFSVAEYYIIKNQAPKVFNGKVEDVQKKINAANNIGISLVDYYNIKSEISNIKADKYSNGKTISGSKKQKVVDYVNSLDYLDDEQKYGMLSSIYKKW